MHGSKMYLPSGLCGASAGGARASKPVPPPGLRTKRFVIGAVRCEPGRNESAPFSGVHFSSAIQKPTAEGGSVYCVPVAWVFVETRGGGWRLTRNVLSVGDRRCQDVYGSEKRARTNRCVPQLDETGSE